MNELTKQKQSALRKIYFAIAVVLFLGVEFAADQSFSLRSLNKEGPFIVRTFSPSSEVLNPIRAKFYTELPREMIQPRYVALFLIMQILFVGFLFLSLFGAKESNHKTWEKKCKISVFVLILLMILFLFEINNNRYLIFVYFLLGFLILLKIGVSRNLAKNVK